MNIVKMHKSLGAFIAAIENAGLDPSKVDIWTVSDENSKSQRVHWVELTFESDGDELSPLVQLELND